MGRAFLIARTQHLVYSTTGRFSDSRPTTRLLPIRTQQIVDPTSSETSDLKFEISESRCLGDFRMDSEQTLTAARPSRIFTAFPFAYLGPKQSETCSRTIHLAKNSGHDRQESRPCQQENFSGRSLVV